MMTIIKNIISPSVIAVIILLAAACAYPKTREYSGISRGLFSAGEARGLSVPEIEARFRPFLEERAGNVRGARAVRPSEKDFLLLMKVWDNTSAEFRALYGEATAKPRNADSLISPMGKFKIFYTTSGRDSVDITDNIGYGVKGQPSAWRVRNPSPNGTPDYIDEAALALDSAWAMEIGRFNFPNPIAAAGADYYYPVYVNNMYDYGGTVPTGKFPAANAGFFSYIEINSDWSDWGSLGYDKRPYDALRVTCAHEFLHAIQYAMVWNNDLDDIPLGWLEGSAVLMEELAYPEVNDYFQYISDFFKNPRISLLSDDDEYLNSILLKYLYEKINARDSIGFIKAVHTNNLDKPGTPFHSNIEQASAGYARKSWAETLNGFHAESYFTGKRARRPWAFVTDADSMDSWAIPAASISGAETKTVKPYSVEFFRCAPQNDAPDTLILYLSGQTDPSVSGKTWGASVLVMEKGDSVGIIPVSMNKNGTGLFKLGGWKEKTGCLLAATNASHAADRKLTVTIEREGFNPPPPDDAVTVSHNVVKLRTATKPVSISGGGVTDVKVYSPDGKLVWSGKNSSDGGVEWHPDKRLTPGAYFLTAASGKKTTLKRKIMILP